MIIIKEAKIEELDKLIELENLAFPTGEAASKETFAYRIEKYGKWFRTAKVRDSEGKEVIAGYICGIPVEVDESLGIDDEMYDPKPYPEGNTFAFLAIGTDPEWRRQGIGEYLIKTIIFLTRENGFDRIILACKDEKVHYYEKFGFKKMGLSKSCHGGAIWYDMDLKL